MKNHALTLGALLTFIFFSSCKKEVDNSVDSMQRMREFVISISQTAKSQDSDFIIIPQNGIELVTEDGEPNSPLAISYLDAIDGHGQEDLYYGYDIDNVASPAESIAYLTGFLNRSKSAGNTILAIDYCWTPAFVDQSYQNNFNQAYISFAADDRELRTIPTYPSPIFNENSEAILSLSQAKNFLYLINNDTFDTKQDFIDAVTATNYDLLVMDLFFWDGNSFSSQEVSQLKNKANGGKRLVICYMSIGEAEDYRYYWNSDWASNKPVWLDAENPDWPGNYKVKYWESDWQKIIYGNSDSYLTKIQNAGFDGVYLDIIDAFEYYE